MDFRDSFWASAEGHWQTLTQSDLVFINPGIYLHCMATVPKSNFRPTWANSGAYHSVCLRYIAGFMKTWSIKNTAILGQTRVIVGPINPENHRKERKERRELEREKKRLATVFSFYSVDFGVFERQKTSAEEHSQTQSYSEQSPLFYPSQISLILYEVSFYRRLSACKSVCFNRTNSRYSCV